jgi:nucleoside 2-deoxyribosyltransferase
MRRANVYLCGAITGDPETFSWRDDVAEELDFLFDIARLNPLRGKDLSTIKGNDYTSNIPGHVFVTRDLNDIRNADIMLCNFLIIPDRQMIGSLIEIGYAYSLGIPILVVANDPMITEHPFIKYVALEIAESIHDAVETIGIIFSDGNHIG